MKNVLRQEDLFPGDYDKFKLKDVIKVIRDFKKKRTGHVYRGETKYIDPDTKKQRNYVVVRDNGKNVSVAKLKSVKKENDSALFEIDYRKYGLSKRTGVDLQTFSKNRMSNKPLSLSDRRVFPEGKERFKLSSHDTHKAIVHTQRKKPR